MIWVIDDFYPNPDEIREKALKLDYVSGFGKNPAKRFHPGSRAIPNKKFWWENRLFLRQRWASIANLKIIEVESMKANCAFNLGMQDRAERFNWIHSDDPRPSGKKKTPPMYACVIYLTPNPPDKSGTILFEHDGNIYDKYQTKKDMAQFEPTFHGSYWTKQYKNPNFKPHTIVSNRYNRCIMYRADMLHAPEDAGFGESKETARLTQLGFWYAEN